MGIRGLTTLVDNRAQDILQDLSLHDTKLVIDGNALLFHLLAEIHGADPVSHGGEYELLRSKIHSFFQNLQRCGCSPYAIFDGSFDLDDKKHNTLLERFQHRIQEAKRGSAMMMPPLSTHLMKQAMEELDAPYAVSQFEADRDIASLANVWRCPVLGKDSDFFVMDITGGYIPMTHLRWKVTQKTKQGQCFIRGHIYHIDSFCAFFSVRRELLPLFATLAGNDYVDSSSFSTFISHVSGKYKSSSSKREMQLEHLLRWLGDQTSCERALEEVWNHVPYRKKLEGPIFISLEMYQVKADCIYLKSFFEGESQQLTFSLHSQLCRDVGAPAWVAEAHRRGLISNVCINILSKRYCFSGIQVENHKEPSSWLSSRSLFAVLCGIILAKEPRKKNSERLENCTVYIRNGDGFQRLKVPPALHVEGYGQLPSLGEVPSLSHTDTLNLIIQVLTQHDSGCVDLDQYPNDFHLSLLVTVHWINSEGVNITQIHIYALLVGWVHLYAQRQRKRKPTKQSSSHKAGTDCHGSGECMVETEALEANIKRHERTLHGRKPNTTISHGFAQWQHCMLNALFINEVLRCPLPGCPDISILFNGLIMHSLYTVLRDSPGKGSIHQWTEARIFRDAPRALNLFNSMLQFVSTCSRTSAQVGILTQGRVTSRAKKPSRRAKKTRTRQAHKQGNPQTSAGKGTSHDEDTASESTDQWRLNNRYATLM